LSSSPWRADLPDEQWSPVNDVLSLAQVRAVLEEPVCNSLNGKHSWWSTGFAYGVWTGVMRALDIDIQVSCMLEQRNSCWRGFIYHTSPQVKT